MTARTITSLRAQAPQPRRGVSALESLYLGLQDLAFEALTELRYGLDRLTQAGQYDDQETAIEQEVYRDMRVCGCACCRLHLPRLLRSDGFDHQERTDGYEAAAIRFDNGADYVRASSTQIESGRVLVLAARRGKEEGA